MFALQLTFGKIRQIAESLQIKQEILIIHFERLESQMLEIWPKEEWRPYGIFQMPVTRIAIVKLALKRRHAEYCTSRCM